jgi:hypothetical protein
VSCCERIQWVQAACLRRAAYVNEPNWKTKSLAGTWRDSPHTFRSFPSVRSKQQMHSMVVELNIALQIRIDELACEANAMIMKCMRQNIRVRNWNKLRCVCHPKPFRAAEGVPHAMHARNHRQTFKCQACKPNSAILYTHQWQWSCPGSA